MESELERLFQAQSRALETANAALRRSDQLLAAERDSVERLRHVATQLMVVQGVEALYEEILDATVAILGVDFASIQMFYPERGPGGQLRLLGHRGFSAAAAKRWEWVGPMTRTTCGEALRTGRKITVADVRNCDFMAGSEDLDGYLDVGIRAAQTLPLVSRSGALLGMVSSYWREPHELSVSELRALDVLARLAADLIERSRIEETLRESEQRLLSIYNTVRDVIFHLAIEPEGQFRFVSVNAAFLRVTGLSLETVIGKTVNEVIPEPSLSMVLGKYRQAIEENTVVHWEETSDYPTGRLTGEVSVAPVFDKTGTCTHLVGLVHDITERKRAEEQRSRLAAIVESSDIAIIGETVDGTIVSWNCGAEKLYGYKAEEVVGRDKSPMIPPDRLDQARLAREPLSRGARLPSFETRGVRKDGRQVPISLTLSPIIDSAGAVVGISAIARDITARKQAEAALRESEERFRNMADAAPVMIWVADVDANCTFMNKSWLTFTGRTLEQQMGHGWTASIHPDDLDRCFASFSAALNARRNFQTEYRARRADGEYRCVLGNGVPRFGSDGSFMGYIGSCVDITDLKLAHEERLAEQRLETVGALAGGIAHDFNNLLGGVLALSELALAEVASGSHAVEELQGIRSAAIRGAEIVRQMMVYAGEETQELELVSVSAIVEDMLELLTVSVSKHVTVKTDLSQQLPVVRAIPAQIRQIVMNLITNASEAIGDRDGVIRVTTSQVTVGGHSTVATSDRLAKGDYVQMEVSDTGRGMTPEVQARIFDPFFTTKGMGTHGLGLAAVRAIVERLHGTIRLSSAPGTGTTVQILLPSEEQMSEVIHSAIARAEDETYASRGATILVVEDEDLLRHGVSKMLWKMGLSVMEAGDGSAALDVIRAHSGDIDLLLLDITLPGASSREVYEQAKRLRPDLPVIVTSAKSKEIATTSLAMGIEHFLRKPFSLGDLIEMVRQILSGGEPQKLSAKH